MSFRLIDSGLSEPAFTAAADEAILSARIKNRVPDTLHFYIRKRPTISLGYFQSAGEDMDLDYCRAQGIEILRRTSGGSAVYTDPGQLIYALVVEDIFPNDREEAYRIICSGIIAGLANLGINADFKPPNDVKICGKKVSGSAQKRKEGVILQHGTLIVNLDRERMLKSLKGGKGDEITSLAEETGQMPDFENLKRAVTGGFERLLDKKAGPSDFTDSEKREIERLVAEKYGNPHWNLKR